MIPARVPVAAGRLVALAYGAVRAAGRVAMAARFEYSVRPTLRIDRLVAIDERSFYVQGWVKDKRGTTDLSATVPDGQRVDLLARAVCYPRPDVDHVYRAGSAESGPAAGFSCYCALERPVQRDRAWTIVARNVAGHARTVHARSVLLDAAATRALLLQELTVEPPRTELLRRDHVRPALERLQARLAAGVGVTGVTEYGRCRDGKGVSIIVPLYRRVDFLEQQLAQFVHDREIADADLIYVLDSPELARRVIADATQLARLYDVPFRLVTLNRTAGYAVANNIGASLARGRWLVLLNSDVLPARPGWLGRMRAFYERTPGIGALGVKLLYEDDSLQHAGMFFSRPAGASVWENMHYFKGLHRDLPAANVTRVVPAVTGACLMIRRDLYQRLGGLRGMYVQGDYEDSDLCLRLAEAGYETWYLPTVELYHLEAQSYPDEVRRLNRAYNTWLHTYHWSERITAMMRDPAPDLVAVDRPPREDR